MTVDAGPIPFGEAIEFFKGKVNLPTERWDDLMRQAHVRGFSVAGLMRDDWITEVRSAVEKAIVGGTGLAEFQKDFEAFVDRSGWKFNAAGKTEADKRAWRARIIYKTNMRVSYMAGRYKQLTDPDVLKYRPYWQYKHSGAMHPRKMHLAWDGMVLDATDPWWDVHFPPNGWGCGCDVKALSRRQLATLGKSGPDPAPGDETYPGKDKRTGAMEIRHQGIDRGWEYNPGKEWLHGIVPRPLREELYAKPPSMPYPMPQKQKPSYQPSKLPPLPPPTPVNIQQLLPDNLSAQDYADRFLAEFGIPSGGNGLFRDKAGGIIGLNESFFHERDTDGNFIGLKSDKNHRGPYMLLLAAAMKDPDEIWVDWDPIPGPAVAMKRAYIKRFDFSEFPAAIAKDLKANKTTYMFMRMQWYPTGWWGLTTFYGDDRYVQPFRAGALLFAKK